MLPGRTNFRVRVYPPNQAHEAAFEMSNYTKSAERAAFLMLQRPGWKGETKVFLVPDWSHGAAPENYGGEVIINSHTHTWVSFYIESEKRVDDIFQHCSKNADLCLILFWNLIDSLKENLIYSLMFFWLIRTYSFRIPQISGQTVSEFFFGNIFTPG